MANVLGVGGSIHDFSSCLLFGNKVIAIEDERLSRVRYGINNEDPCILSTKYCMEKSGLFNQNIDVIVANDDIPQQLDRIAKSETYERINHHLSHAYSTFFTSKFEKAAILIVDGAGSKKNTSSEFDETRETTSFYLADLNSEEEIKCLGKVFGTLDGHNPISKKETILSNSIGEFYRLVSNLLDLGWLSGPGKMMGMSSYGQDVKSNFYASLMLEHVTFLDNGQFEIQMNGQDALLDRLFQLIEHLKGKKHSFPELASIALAGQIVFEKLLLHCLDHLYEITQVDNLCIAGGAGLNSIMNGKIYTSSRFKSVHIPPFPGDNGLAIGNAIWGMRKLVDRNFRPLQTPYLGYSYKKEEILKSLENSKYNYEFHENIVNKAVEILSKGNLLGWFQGASEFGPRALGNRSFLADPRCHTMRDTINSDVKKREWYRPLAPAIISSYCEKYYNTPPGFTSRNMEFVTTVRPEYAELLPAVTHIDLSARVQTVSEADNLLFYNLLDSFRKKTGCPILLNTSFNVDGEPIVETPDEALSAFERSSLQYLIIGNYLIRKI